MCAVALEVAVPLCSRLGLPVAPHKVEGPATVLTFLGIEIDTQKQELRLPQVVLYASGNLHSGLGAGQLATE